MLYLTCTMITSVDLAYYGVSRAKDWVSADCGTRLLLFCPQYEMGEGHIEFSLSVCACSFFVCSRIVFGPLLPPVW